MENESITQKIYRLRMTVESHPENPDSWMELGNAYVAHIEAGEAQICYERSLALHPSATANSALGRILLSENRLKPAAARLNEAYNLDPKDGEVAGLLGIACLKLGERQKATPLLQQALAANPANEEARMGLARILAADGDFKGGIKACQEILESNPKNCKDPLLLLGDCFLGLGSLESGEQCYAVAVKQFPDDPQVLAALASLHHLSGRDKIAEKELKEGLERNPNSADIHLVLAQIYFSRKEAAQTRAACEEALDCDGDCYKAYSTLGMVDLLEGDFAGAAVLASKGLEIAPADPDCLLVAAQACELQGQFIETAEFAQRAVAAAPKNPHAHLMLARAEVSLRRDLQKAHKHLVLAEKFASNEQMIERIRNLRLALEQRGIASK